MCGIAGILDPTGKSAPDALLDVAGRMAARQAHRGPDGQGLWADPGGMLALGHRRLAILDLSPAGHQPMVSQCGRFALAYNGEVYNHLELRREVDAARAYSGRPALAWRGHSDTEILLEACALWGAEGALSRCAGMFALALWDGRERSLTLARDRMGEKPLYYAFQSGRLVFASELPGLMAVPQFSARVDRGALALLLRLSCIPAPHSILEGVRKLPAGHLVEISAADLSSTGLPAPRPWWSLRQMAQDGLMEPFEGGEGEALEALLARLRQSVRGQMIADVPLGALLSGGVDSSLIAALMAEAAPGGGGQVRTFTIGYDDPAYDESAQAEGVARHLGTLHTRLVAKPEDALALVPRLAAISGEPFADASLLPTRLVAELTRREVTVCLSGDGGDELFAGYNRHAWGPALWGRIGGLPPGLRKLAAAALTSLSPAAWDRLFAALAPLLPASARQRLPGEKLHKLAQALPARIATTFYARLVSAWLDPGLLVRRQGRGTSEPQWALRLPGTWPDPGLCPPGGTLWMQFLDTAWYLPEDILTKVDRAAMSVSLESRAPYLDHRVAELAWRLPEAMRLRNGQGKWPLRELLARYVPRPLWERPKMGFGVPLDAWLRGPLKDWAGALLNPARLAREGFLDPAPMARAWAEHQSGRFNRQYQLWPALMFGSWLETFGVSE